MLSKEEEKEIENLPRNFNIFKENKDYFYKSVRRIEIAKKMIPILIKTIIYINVLTVVLILSTLYLSLTKQKTNYYAAWPNGEISYLKKIGK